MPHMDLLLARISEECFERDGWLKIVGADWFADDLRLDVALNTEDGQKELWEINCEGVFSERLSSEIAVGLYLTDDSTLLIPYKDKEIQVSFSENKISPSELFGIVTSTCYEMLGASADLSRFLNMELSIEGICSSSYGLLGRFPDRVAAKLSERLSGLDINIGLLDGSVPKYWHGNEYASYPANIKVLLIGSSYVIGTEFNAEQA